MACVFSLSSAMRRLGSVGRRSMMSWQIDEYGSFDNLRLRPSATPSVSGPRDVLVKVHAASVNPLDTAMLGGYGSKILGYLRWADQLRTGRSADANAKKGDVFPLTLGRDFSGTVTAVGKGVTAYKPGDEVWGIVLSYSQGSHAEMVVTTDDCISAKPKNVSHEEAASLPYVSLTYWAAASTAAGLNSQNASGKRVLINGGSGGLGTFGIQLLKAWGAAVVTTVSTDSVPLATRLGSDLVIDYKTQNVNDVLSGDGGVDAAIDCVGSDSIIACVKPNGVYVTCRHPTLALVDRYGLPGTVSVATTFAYRAAQAYRKYGVLYRWAFVMPNADALKEIRNLVEEDKVRPVIDRRFTFDKLPDAYRHVADGRSRGKSVIQICSS